MPWRMQSILLRTAAVIVTALHARFLWQRVEDLSITQPEVIARWCAAVSVATAALFLMHLRASWRTWLVFWVVIVLFHVAVPVDARLDILAETVFALAPLIAWMVARGLARPPAGVARVDEENVTLTLPRWVISLPCRAPPGR